MNLDKEVLAGASIYGRVLLLIYDWYVLGLSNTYAWNCPVKKIIEFYESNLSTNHLDIGVGTGFYLDKCKFPRKDPKIVLGDLNTLCLQKTAQRIRRYNPSAFQLNVLDEIDLSGMQFDSIAINYLLHCLPGNFEKKGVIFKNLKPLLKKSGVIFGTTILGQGVKFNLFGRLLMNAYNWKGIFSNNCDNLDSLRRAIEQQFKEYTLEVKGCVAFFTIKNS